MTLIEANRELHVKMIMKLVDHLAGLNHDLGMQEKSGSQEEIKEAIDKTQTVRRYLEHRINQILKAHYEAARPPVL
jgi:hypothetical protein